MRACILGFVGFVLVSCAKGAPPEAAAVDPGDWFVTPDEAVKDVFDNEVRGSAAESTGPRVVVASPSNGATYHGQVPFKVVFEPSTSGAAPDMSTLRVTYLRGWGINITSRVMPYFSSGGFDYPDAKVPVGTHAFEIYIEDAQENPTVQTVRFTVE